MGIFRKRRTAPPAAWTPLRRASIPLAGGDADVNDDGQVFESAYMVAFGMKHPEGAVITVCTYAAYAEDERYSVGLRYQYASEAHPGWAYSGWEADPWGALYDEAARAEVQARELADFLASGGEDLAAWMPQVFGWDGEWFAVAEAREV